jgi:2-oxoglutarate ferredoxin oxidoreductase subunit delta
MKFWRLPLDADEQDIPVGELFIIVDRCKGCDFCIEFCPNKVLEASPEFNNKGYHPPVMKENHECNNCGLCEVICPEFAIYSKIKEKRRFTEIDLLRYEEISSDEGEGEQG